MLPVHKQVSLSNDPGRMFYLREPEKEQKSRDREPMQQGIVCLWFLVGKRPPRLFALPGGEGECFSKIAHFESMTRGPVSIIELIVLWCLGELAQIGGTLLMESLCKAIKPRAFLWVGHEGKSGSSKTKREREWN